MDKTRAIALDQSTVAIGYSIWDDGVLKKYGLFTPDFPRLDKVREFIRSYCLHSRINGFQPIVIAEDIWLGKNAKTFKELAILIGQIQATTYESGGEFELVTADDALYAITGKREKLVRKLRKKTITALASDMVGEPLKEDVADAISIGLAYIHKTKQGIPT